VNQIKIRAANDFSWNSSSAELICDGFAAQYLLSHRANSMGNIGLALCGLAGQDCIGTNR
jgi:hypothetical protein